MAPCDRSQCPELLYASSNVQNGNSRDNQKLGHKRRMASCHQPERCVLSRSHTSRFSTLATFPCRQKNVSVQSSSVQLSNSTPRVHADCKRGKARFSVLWNSSSPVPGRLVVKSKHQCQRQTKELGFVINLDKPELEPTQKIDFLGYHFDLVQGKVFATEKKLKILQKSIQDMAISSQTTPRLLMSLIGVLASLEKTIPMGWLDMRPLQWYLKTNWQYPQSLDLKIPVSNLLLRPSPVVERSKQCENMLSLTSRRAQYPYFHRCIKPGLRSPSRKHDSQWQLDKSRKNITYQCSRVTGSVSSLKKVSKHNSKQKNSGSN